MDIPSCEQGTLRARAKHVKTNSYIGVGDLVSEIAEALHLDRETDMADLAVRELLSDPKLPLLQRAQLIVCVIYYYDDDDDDDSDDSDEDETKAADFVQTFDDVFLKLLDLSHESGLQEGRLESLCQIDRNMHEAVKQHAERSRLWGQEAVGSLKKFLWQRAPLEEGWVDYVVWIHEILEDEDEEAGRPAAARQAYGIVNHDDEGAGPKAAMEQSDEWTQKLEDVTQQIEKAAWETETQAETEKQTETESDLDLPSVKHIEDDSSNKGCVIM